MFRFYKRWSFTKKILVVVNLLSIMALAAIAVITINMSEREAYSALHSKMKTMLAFLQKAAIMPMWNMDNGFLEVLADELLRDPDFNQVDFLDKKNASLTKPREHAPSSYELKGDVKSDKNELIGTINLGYNDSAIKANVKRARLVIVLVSVVAQIFLSFIVFLVMRQIAKPLLRTTSHINVLAGGDFTQDVPEALLELKDEVGQILSATDQMTKSIKDVIRQSSSIANSLANETLKQASAMEETSASLEEMSSMTKQSAGNAEMANSLVTNSKDYVVQSNANMSELKLSMDEISKSSDEISKIIKIIDNIAFQTNILALNAAVEAARAGDQGKGFAVVAEEVRNLSMRSATAAKNITELIDKTITKIKSAAILVNRTSDAFKNVYEGSLQIETLVNEIAKASSEQSTGIDQISKAVTQIDDATQRNSQSSSELARSMSIFKT